MWASGLYKDMIPLNHLYSCEELLLHEGFDFLSLRVLIGSFHIHDLSDIMCRLEEKERCLEFRR